MAFSLMNGLSQMGSGVATFAGQAGLEAQKAQLVNQSAVLADQLATTRETGLQQSAGAIAATAAEKQQTFQAGQTQTEIAARASEGALTRQAEAARTQATINAMPPDVREAMIYAGGAQPGTDAYKQAYQDITMMKQGVSPGMWGPSPSAAAGGGAAGAPAASASAIPLPPGPRATGGVAAEGSVVPPAAGAVPAPATAATSPAAAGTPIAYVPKEPGLDHGAPAGGYNEAFLAGKPEAFANQVRALNEGRQEPPGPRSLTEAKSPEFALNAALNVYNPGFDATLYPARLEARKAIATGGSLSVPLMSMNGAMGHIDHLGDLYDQLGNSGGGVPLASLVRMPINTLAATSGRYPVIGQIKQTVEALATEGNRVYAGNAGTENEIAAWKDSFPLNGSITDQKAALQNFAQLLGSKFDAMSWSVNRDLGYPGRPGIELMSPKAKAVYQKWSAPAPEDQPGAANPNAPMTPQQMYGGVGAVSPGASRAGATPALPPGFRIVQ